MPQLLFATLILCAGYYALKFFARASPGSVAQMVRYGGGTLAGLGGLFLLLRGRPDLGVAGIGFGLWLTGLFRLPGRSNPFAPKGSAAQSTARSATLAVELDHATGSIRGRTTGGPQGGRDLHDLTRGECDALLRWCVTDDPEGARLLEAYMDRRFPGWREARQAEKDTGRAAGRARGPGLSEQDAYEILGLAKGATRADVVRAHRALMKKFHPDHGGATDFAAQVNEAKEVLLRCLE